VIINGYVLYVAINRVLIMVNSEEPYVSSIEHETSDDSTVMFNHVTKTMFQILEGDTKDPDNDDNLFKLVPLDRHSR